MIRPVLYVDLPGIIYSIDRRARSKQNEYANFVCWLEPDEKRHSFATYPAEYLSAQSCHSHMDRAKTTGVFWASPKFKSDPLTSCGTSRTWLRWHSAQHRVKK